jgi:serine/threonine protein kinase/tetratricopeptide (TPR) repeat protein
VNPDAVTAASDGCESATHEVVGPYRLVKLLGEGGFGHVWLAEQVEPIRRSVALKLVKPGMDSKEVLARFETERRALALMDHPNIARVLDAGLTKEGRPYFAMEYVRGEPITEFCDKQRLSMKERLGLFVEVCRAVQHAHRKGIIHRDLKPSNILVTRVDGRPEPKIIDFGIARAMYTPSAERTMATGLGQMLGTPEYMSPEQAGEVGYEGDIDTRTDVYSLGVILYLLLTGALPFDSKTLRAAGFDGIRKLIVEVTPPKPSTRLEEAALGKVSAGSEVGKPPTLKELAQRRGTEARQLSRLIRGDLDWIVMKCLEKERARRYESASALAEDLQRHLKDEPVVAGPPSASYRAAKFFRRHRVGVGVAGVFVALVLIALAGMSVLYANAEEQRHAADEARVKADALRDKAEQEAGKASAAVNFVLDMFESIDPAVAQGRDVLVRDLLVEAEKKALGLREQPLVEATVREMLGKAYQRLGVLDSAKANLDRAADIRRQKLGPDDPETLLAEFECGATEVQQGHVKEAEEILRRVYAAQSRVLGSENDKTLQTLSIISEVEKAKEDYSAAEKTVRQVIAGQTRTLGAGHRDTIDSRCGLADLLEQVGKLDDAEKEAASAVEDAKKSLGENDPMTLQAMSIRASILDSMDRSKEAVEVARDVVARKRKVLGPDHPGTLVSINGLATYLGGTKEGDAEAEGLYREVVRSAEAKLGPGHSTTLTYKNNLAQCLRRRKKYKEAEPLYRDVLEAQKKVNGEQSRATLTTMNNLGLLLLQDGRPEQALPFLQDTLKGLQATTPPDHWIIGASKTYVSQCLIDLGRIDEAEKLLNEAYSMLASKMGEKHDRTRQTAMELARLWEKRGDAGKAAEWKAKGGPGEAK